MCGKILSATIPEKLVAKAVIVALGTASTENVIELVFFALINFIRLIHTCKKLWKVNNFGHRFLKD